MPKLKTNRAAAKRFKATGTGKIKRMKCGKQHILDDFAEGLADIAQIDKAPKVEGRSMTMFLAGKKN